MFEGLFRPGHLIILLVIVLLVFGPQKLPQLGEALGKTLRGFKQALNEQAPPQQPGAEATKSSPPGKEA
jgi:sec-independent protein translocase protein TatA